tara:strand:- start:186 stop:989 length:804 start_codon:yes stop_codon:yes gene_type:complete
MKSKIIDCITFFQENLMFKIRYEVLKDIVDYFVVCESIFDHKGRNKNLNFDKKLIKDQKIKYIIHQNNFNTSASVWQNQAEQRDFMLNSLKFVDDEDLIFFSDPDEIPNPEILKNFKLQKKYGIFFQQCFNYKFNLYNPHESPWEGTRVCKKKNLKSIDFMRQKVLSKNLKYPFWRFDKEKDLEIIYNGGWHFNNILSPEQISLKLKTFAHTQFADDKYSNPDVIKKKINEKIDLFERGHCYVKKDKNIIFPDYLLNEINKYEEFLF